MHTSSPTPPGAVDFRVVSYNVLAEIYATRQMYPYCPLWAIKWSYRKVQLLKEMKMLNGDIVCLQEVQNNHFKVSYC
jgi:CCR4-NOT transcription complex subunit 6